MKKNITIIFIKILFFIILILFFILNLKNEKNDVSKKKNLFPTKKITEIKSKINPTKKVDKNSIIYKLRKDENKRIPKYILLMDYYQNPYCNDINAYYIFKRYKENKNENAYYVINKKSKLFQNLVDKNETENLIPVNSNDDIFEKLYNYILNSKIIINSYVMGHFQKLVSHVSFLKFLYLTHAIGYFKKKIIAKELIYLKPNKRNIIVSSPFEYNYYKKQLNYSDNYMHKAGLPRYDRFQFVTKNISEKKCILITFTYRKYSNNIYNQSLFKKNLEKLLRNQNLLEFLGKKQIDLIYIPHHFDIFRNRSINPQDFPDIKYMKQEFLSHYIEQCSLFITDFSSIAFDFMFLNKPSLFYLIDVKDKIEFEERNYMKYDPTNNIYFGNVFSNQNSLIDRIKYYANNGFNINDDLKRKYESFFYYKNNITEKIINIINEIIIK